MYHKAAPQLSRFASSSKRLLSKYIKTSCKAFFESPVSLTRAKSVVYEIISETTTSIQTPILKGQYTDFQQYCGCGTPVAKTKVG